MARKTLQVTITTEGRDKGKAYFVRELSSTQAENWAIRAFLGLARGGVDLPEGVESTGFAGIAKLGFGLLSKIPFDDFKWLMDEMFTCISMIPNPDNPSVVRSLVEDDIEEIQTRFKLRAEVFALHAGFSSAGGLLTSVRRLATAAA